MQLYTPQQVAVLSQGFIMCQGGSDHSFNAAVYGEHNRVVSWCDYKCKQECEAKLKLDPLQNSGPHSPKAELVEYSTFDEIHRVLGLLNVKLQYFLLKYFGLNNSDMQQNLDV